VARLEGSEHVNKLNYWKGNYDAINGALEKVDWISAFEGKNVEEMWKIFHSKLQQLVIKHVPVKKPVKRRKSQWITRQTTREMQRRGRAWGRYREQPTDSNYSRYKEVRNHVNSLVRRDQDAFRKELMKKFKGNEKRFYGYIRNLQTKPVGITRMSRKDGTLTDSDQDTAKVMGDYFQEVYTREGTYCEGRRDDSCDEAAHRCSESDIRIDKAAVQKLLEKLKPDKSQGPDDVHPMVLKECAANVSEPLSMIFNNSLKTGKVPEDWKKANITPIFKKGRKTDPANYRPVSLTSVVCKIMESLIKEKLVEYLEKNDLLTDKQHGFRSGRSCLTNLLEAFEAWTKALDDGYGVEVIYLDFRKAFDTVPHKRLIEKLRQCGITGQLLKWIEDFLTGRKTRVRVNGSFAEWLEVLSGVPQGSVLGPLLFLIFVNDLPEWIKANIRMFADDTKIWTVMNVQGKEKELQLDLNRLMDWSDKWMLRFNPEKCKVMHVGGHFKTSYEFHNESGTHTLKETEEERDLGILVRNDLKQASQCKVAASKAMSVTGLIKRHFKRLDTEDFLILYRTYIRPHMEFCIQVWSPYLQKDVQILERVQRKATKLVRGFEKIEYSERLERLGLTTLEERRRRGDLIEVYKILSGKERIEADQFFKPAPKEHDLRGNSMKLYQQRSRLDIRKHFFSQRVVASWNRLPQDIISAPTTNTFKNRYDKFYRQDMSN